MGALCVCVAEKPRQIRTGKHEKQGFVENNSNIGSHAEGKLEPRLTSKGSLYSSFGTLANVPHIMSWLRSPALSSTFAVGHAGMDGDSGGDEYVDLHYAWCWRYPRYGEVDSFWHVRGPGKVARTADSRSGDLVLLSTSCMVGDLGKIR